MCAGGVLAYLVLIPAIKFFGEGMTTAAPARNKFRSARWGPNEIRGAYVLYIGAGAVAAGGIISLFRSLPTIWHGLKGGIAGFARRAGGERDSAPRTDQDLSMKFVLVGIVVCWSRLCSFAPGLHINPNLLGALLIIAFGFLFVTVSSRLTGEIGSSSNPISGMTVATLLLTCLIFLIVGWTGPPYYVTALSVGAIVCIAASNGGTTSQDLKTGFLVGAHAEVAADRDSHRRAGASALILGPILLKLNEAATVYVPRISQGTGRNASAVPSLAGLPEQTRRATLRQIDTAIRTGRQTVQIDSYTASWHDTGSTRQIAPAGDKYLV